MYRYKNVALQLSWLPQHLLRMCPVLPEIVSVPELMMGANGLYVHPNKRHHYGGVSCTNGLIVIADTAPSPRATLAHEFRHHWQFFNTFVPEKDYNSKRFFEDALFNPQKAYLDYYRKQPEELDALWFECRVAPYEDNIKGLKMVLEYYNE